MDTNEYLNEVKARHGVTSDYKLAQLLEITRSRLSGYRTTNRNMDDLLCLRVEKLLDLPAGSVLLDIHAQRSKCPESKTLFQKLSKQLISGSMAMSLTLSGFQIFPILDSLQNADVCKCNTVYYVKWDFGRFFVFWLSAPWPNLKIHTSFSIFRLFPLVCYGLNCSQIANYRLTA